MTPTSRAPWTLWVWVHGFLRLSSLVLVLTSVSIMIYCSARFGAHFIADYVLGAFLILLGLPGLTRVYSLLSDTQVRPSRREWGWFSCLEFVATAVALCAGFSLLVAYQNVGVCRFDMTEAECEARGVYHLAKWKGTACALLFAVAGIHLLLTITAWIQCCCLLASRKRSKQLQVKQGI